MEDLELLEDSEQAEITKLDYKLKTCEERAQLVARIIEETPKENLTNRYLEILGDYVMDAITKEEKRSHMYLTDNRLITVNKRETSYEGLVEKFENGEDGIYNLISDNKNEFLQHKAEITPEDIAEIPGLKALREEIENIEEQAKRATGRNKYLLKKQLIDMRRDQYVLKSIFKPVMAHATGPRGASKIELNERRWIDKDGEPQSDGLVTFFNPKHISAILCCYSDLKAATRGKFQSDFYCLIEDFDVLMRNSLAAEPVYKEIVRMRIRGCQYTEIQKALLEKFGKTFSTEYLSVLWRNKIPKLISDYAKEEYLIWHYTIEEEGTWKKCSCCGKKKLAHNYFFSRNKTSKDGFYSICKECRKAKK